MINKFQKTFTLRYKRLVANFIKARTIVYFLYGNFPSSGQSYKCSTILKYIARTITLKAIFHSVVNLLIKVLRSKIKISFTFHSGNFTVSGQSNKCSMIGNYSASNITLKAIIQHLPKFETMKLPSI